MKTVRIIPCLDCDIINGKPMVVKGKKFEGLETVGDPIGLARKYSESGADELCFLDITATIQGRKSMLETIEKAGKEVFIPMTAGGGIRTLEDAKAFFMAGADKICVNSAAVKNPGLIRQVSANYGSQACVVAIDAKKTDRGYEVFIEGGTKGTGLNALEWAKKAQSIGAGEILLTSIDADGTKTGFDIGLTKMVSDALSIPVIASGGAGRKKDFYGVFSAGRADAALAASVFHYGKYGIPEIKQYLKNKGIMVRK